MIKRSFEEDLSKLNVKREIKEVKKDNSKYEPLKRVLVIGPNYPERCHFSENIYDLWSEDPNYDIRIIGDLELPINSMHIEKGLRLPLSNVINLLDDWQPQLTIVDQININFWNDLREPVFYHHRNYFRNPRVNYPTLVWFWHENILKYYETNFAKEWMAQVQYKDLMYIPFNPIMYHPEEKIYKGVNGIGFREIPNEIDDMFEAAPQEILLYEYNKFIDLGFNMFESPIMDDQYRDLLPKCEAIWCPLSRRQFTSRRIIEAMACKTIVVLKLENRKHEEILQNMGFYNGEHYIGVNKLSEIKDVYNKTKDKKKIVENAYNVVMTNHTYQNRIDQIIKTYEEITNKSV